MGNTYDMDLKVGRSRGKRKLALVTMGLETNHTISYIYTTYFVLRVSYVCEVCKFLHSVWVILMIWI